MAVLTDDPPKNTRRSALLVLVLGTDLLLTTLFIAYEFTYGAFGAHLTGAEQAAGTALIFTSIILALASIYMGAVTYWSERLNRMDPPQYPSNPR